MIISRKKFNQELHKEYWRGFRFGMKKGYEDMKHEVLNILNSNNITFGDPIEDPGSLVEQETCVTMRDLSDEEIKHFAEEMKKVRVQVVEQRPCEDAVSRKAVLNLARDLDFSKVKGLEHYKHRCIEVEDVEELASVTPDLSSLREINEALTKRVKYLENMERYAMPGTPIHRDRTVQDFVDKCRECGARYGKLLKKMEWIPTSERQPEENGNYLAFYHTSDGTASLEFMMVDHCNAGGGWLHEEKGRKAYKKVVAWMPLPAEPYNAEMEGKE